MEFSQFPYLKYLESESISCPWIYLELLSNLRDEVGIKKKKYRTQLNAKTQRRKGPQICMGSELTF